ncbi:MAG: AMP-binding protein, partial [Cyclobacteriaceae bacterium]|nr:AMP-binding protein [Cyclobacteriaceae bacterium HetDA_MAG_MS6]
MEFLIQNEKLTIDDIIDRQFDEKKLSEPEIHAINFIRSWEAGTREFVFQTSGSTGRPKAISLSRDILSYSARQTLDFLGLPEGGWTLLCIHPKFIGGAMVIVRALINKMNLHVVEPSSTLTRPGELVYDLISMVPLQIATLLGQKQSFSAFRNILIGGAGIDQNQERELAEINAKFYHTYGMTETASHIAIRAIDTPYFNTLGDIKMDIDSRGALALKGTVTANQWIQTNDLVELKSD